MSPFVRDVLRNRNANLHVQIYQKKVLTGLQIRAKPSMQIPKSYSFPSTVHAKLSRFLICYDILMHQYSAHIFPLDQLIDNNTQPWACTISNFFEMDVYQPSNSLN